MNPLRLGEALHHAQTLGLARLDAQLLLLHALGRDEQDRAWLLAHDGDAMPMDRIANFHQLLQRRLNGEPWAYICGHKEFFGLRLAVNPHVLVPRPDTETLVEWALQLPHPPKARVLDLGTGSGAIALALKSQRPNWQLHASDASAQALDVARANGERLGWPVVWQQGSWFQAWTHFAATAARPRQETPSSLRDTQDKNTLGFASDFAGGFDLIVSNPPYIAADDPHLQALQHEPPGALGSGADGLDDLREIVQQSPAHLKAGGWLLLEHGHDQAAAVRQLLHDSGFQAVQSRRDLAGIERCSGGQS